MAEAADRPQHEAVSDDSEALILVDGSDRAIGTMTKAACHDGDGVLHRAFSLFIFNRAGELLLQKRAPQKRLWPLFWSNSCCSHPRLGEDTDDAIHRRLDQELGMTSELRHLYTFQYQARYRDVGSENELCHVFAGVSDDEVRANDTEIAAWRWITPDQLDAEMKTQPEIFTPWFTMEWQRVRSLYRDVVNTPSSQR